MTMTMTMSVVILATDKVGLCVSGADIVGRPTMSGRVTRALVTPLVLQYSTLKTEN